MTRVQADIIPATVDWLAAQSAIIATTAQVRDNVPETWTPDQGPLLIVEDDGGPAVMPIKSQHTIRLTGWAPGRTQARQIASLAAGLLVYGRPAGVGHVNHDMGGVIDARDPKTGAMLASVLATMHARTVDV